MGSPENSEEELRDCDDDDDGGTTLRRSFLRSCFAVAFAFLIILLLSFSVLYFAVLIANLSIWSPISVQSRCRIVSSSVDLRSSKVEYIDHSGQARFASAEAPKEALPYKCRPNFGAAWLTKDKFKVNETYECWYTLGVSKVNINNEGLFNCQAEDLSTVEMLKRYSILFTRLLKSWVSGVGSIHLWRWDLIAGAISGFIMSLLSVTLIGVLYPLLAIIRRLFASWTFTRHPSTILLKRVCFFAVYFSFMSWVTVQYVQRLSLS
ncbi:uncharacterized protein LOC125222848 isoform X2 [Salvia hispanica]|uniref:uncharacterized protein LOC125222848 isoform X2 n=1 Tax=Salvia hispanica TaxID=49212 RepID=UPI002009C575|nr:uncharacterized protein LOC125222848 isoform X2 [Salvia hispanica]